MAYVYVQSKGGGGGGGVNPATRLLGMFTERDYLLARAFEQTVSLV